MWRFLVTFMRCSAWCADLACIYRRIARGVWQIVLLALFWISILRNVLAVATMAGLVAKSQEMKLNDTSQSNSNCYDINGVCLPVSGFYSDSVTNVSNANRIAYIAIVGTVAIFVRMGIFYWMGQETI